MLDPVTGEEYRDIGMQRRIAVGPSESKMMPYSLRVYWDNNAPGTRGIGDKSEGVLTSYLTEDDVAWLIQEFLKERTHG